MILRTDDMPEDPIEAIIWLDGVKEAVQVELDQHYQRAYYMARLTRRFPEALRLGRTSRKRALQYTRRENEANGRTVRWNDGFDTRSTDYDPSTLSSTP